MTVNTLTYKASIREPVSRVGLWWRRFFIRLRSWEYWPVYIFNIPVIGIWIWNALKARDFFFFTLTNPGIETGGFFGESKSAILQYIPEGYKPKTILVKAQLGNRELESILQQSGLHFPLIAKPEVGERGWLISKLHSFDELKTYRAKHQIDILLQTYVDLPLELSIMVYSMPDDSDSAVTSICEKYFLQIEGDGYSSIGQLIMSQNRAMLHYEKLKKRFNDRWDHILSAGDILILESVGNHCRGTMFLDRNAQIDDPIKKQMVSLLKTMPGVYYGRFDMRVGSWESLRSGKEIRILEFNGTSSDPAHIYQPGYSLWSAYMDIAFHWNIMYKIAKQNKTKGHNPVTFRKIISALTLYYRYKRTN